MAHYTCIDATIIGNSTVAFTTTMSTEDFVNYVYDCIVHNMPSEKASSMANDFISRVNEGQTLEHRYGSTLTTITLNPED